MVGILLGIGFVLIAVALTGSLVDAVILIVGLEAIYVAVLVWGR